LTKYYDGHNMTVGGAVISATAELDTKIHFYQNVHGNILSPQCAFIVLQSTKVRSVDVISYFPVLSTVVTAPSQTHKSVSLLLSCG
jgi:Cys/Met metabolism PLP-dependent enzyme